MVGQLPAVVMLVGMGPVLVFLEPTVSRASVVWERVVVVATASVPPASGTSALRQHKRAGDRERRVNARAFEEFSGFRIQSQNSFPRAADEIRVGRSEPPNGHSLARERHH